MLCLLSTKKANTKWSAEKSVELKNSIVNGKQRGQLRRELTRWLQKFNWGENGGLNSEESDRTHLRSNIASLQNRVFAIHVHEQWTERYRVVFCFWCLVLLCCVTGVLDKYWAPCRKFCLFVKVCWVLYCIVFRRSTWGLRWAVTRV